jgi:hypothetical protein
MFVSRAYRAEPHAPAFLRAIDQLPYARHSENATILCRMIMLQRNAYWGRRSCHFRRRIKRTSGRSIGSTPRYHFPQNLQKPSTAFANGSLLRAGAANTHEAIPLFARVTPAGACLLLAIRASRQMTTEPERAPPSTEAGAIIWFGKGTAQERPVVMEAWGIKLARNPAEIGKLLRSVLQ